MLKLVEDYSAPGK